MSRVRFDQTVSILMSLLLLPLPLPTLLLWFRPDWVLLNIILWTAVGEHTLSIGVVWALGIALDVFYGTPLGLHSFSYLLIFGISLFFKKRLTLYSFWHKLTFVLVLVTVHQGFLSTCLATILDQPLLFYWGPIPMTLLAWPIWALLWNKK